jgi:Ca2+-binding RTX toxin-like protein
MTVTVPGGPTIQIVNNNSNINNNTIIQQQITQVMQVAQVVSSQNSVEAGPNTPAPSAPAPGLPPPPAPTDNFQVVDENASIAFKTAGAPYPGPAAGVVNEFIDLNPDNLNITALTAGAFIHSGAGNDSLSSLAGNNLLNAGGGSNVVIGGIGQDTIIVDAALTPFKSSVADLIQNFHTGDDLVVNGITPADFKLTTVDGNSAFGPSLIITMQQNNNPGVTTTVALAGRTSSEVTSGKLQLSYSTDSSGTPFLLIHAT